jgi:hypothetical protein
MTSGLTHEQKRKPGRPLEVDPDALRRAVSELNWVLELNWGVVGWLLLEAKSRSDVREAFSKIVNQNSGCLEPFRDPRTQRTTSQELRTLRKKLPDIQERHRCDYSHLQRSKESCERAFNAWAAESDPVKQAQIQQVRAGLASEFDHAEALEQASRLALESLRIELREREAYFAQSEILRHLESNRRQFTPSNVARAMAGLPRVTARVSCDQCAKHAIEPPSGIAFPIFQAIQRTVREPLRDLGTSIEIMRELLLNGSGSNLPYARQLRKDWYFLEAAIRLAARDERAPKGSLPYRIFAEYYRTSTSHSVAESVLAKAHRLLKEGEDPEQDQGPYWDSLRTVRVKRATLPRK